MGNLNVSFARLRLLSATIGFTGNLCPHRLGVWPHESEIPLRSQHSLRASF